MKVFEAVPKEWGNSIGITIPREVVDEEDIRPRKKTRFMVLGSNTATLKSIFGTLKLREPAQKAMEEIDEGYD